MRLHIKGPYPFLAALMALLISGAYGFVFASEDVLEVTSPLPPLTYLEDLPKGSFPWGDLDGDGFDDILIASPLANGGKGSAIILYGNSTGRTTEIGSLMGQIGLGSHVRIGDLDSDGIDDLILLDRDWRPFIIWGQQDIPSQLNLEATDVFMDVSLYELLLIDANNDGQMDMVYLEDGISTVIFGPVEPVSRSYDLGPESLTRLYAADIDGDGGKEILALDNSSDLLVIRPDGGEVTMDLGKVPHNASFAFGDLDGDLSDDILYLDLDGSDHGSINIIYGSHSPKEEDTSIITAIKGSSEYPLSSETVITCTDIDRDGTSDIIIGSPEHHGGLGALRIFSGKKDRINSPKLITDPDSSIVGNSSFSPIGGSIIAGADMDGDLLPEIIIGDEKNLRKLDLPSNSPPGDLISGWMFLDQSSEQVRIAEIGDLVGIRIRAIDRSESTIDLMAVEIDSPSGTSRIILKETEIDSGEFMGHILLSSYTMDGRSIACSIGDLLMARSDNGWSYELFVAGTSGIDDPPILVGEVPRIVAVEDEYYEMTLDIVDPDGDPIVLVPKSMPSWLTLNGTRISGTPGNDDISSGNFTINATSTVHHLFVDIEFEVINRPPAIIPISAPNQAWEGSEYLAVFQLREDGNKRSLHIVRERGPGPVPWIEAGMDGVVRGTPENIDVGSWVFSLLLHDGNDGWANHTWTVQVINIDPVLDEVPPIRWMEHVELVLDINCTGEGDNLTRYSMEGESHGARIDGYSGFLRVVPVIRSQKNITITVKADDGHGGHSTIDVSIEIINQAPFLLAPLPGTITSWRTLDIDMSSNEDELGVSLIMDPIPPFIFRDGSDPYMIRAFPWNMDAGDHLIELVIRDVWGGERNYEWNFTVVSDTSMQDPEIVLSSARYTSLDHVEISFIIDNGSAPVKDVRIRSTGSEDEWMDIVLKSGGWRNGSVTVDAPPERGRLNLSIEVSFYLEGGFVRNVVSRAELDPGDPPERRTGAIFLILTLTMMMILIGLGASLLKIERTSLALQAAFIKDGKASEDDMLPIIQDRPGITWRQLQSVIPLDRKDALATLESLESGGHVYEITDGFHIRLYPMMGSFKDRPLVLNRYQGMIARALLASSRGMDEEDISKATGIDTVRIRKECQLMQLKGAISIKRRRTLDVYSLNVHQREMLKRWSR
ncbi:MAG: FG-GAP-like repeat-containing protein [Candidatus Thermoplasmatota archaeon]|nr:FG-GAP-like repeat-containing protein [Candidatus Thermoplasmatota archaeon]